MSINLSNMGLVFSEDDFFNPEYKIDFIESKYVNYSKESVQQIVNVFKRIGEVEKQFKKDMSIFSLEEFKSLFEINKWVSSGVIDNKQSLIREYMRWYRGKGLDNWQDCNIPETIDQIGHDKLSRDSIYELEWFTSLEELQNDIDILFDAYEGADDHELDTAITLLYFPWYDVDSDEAVKIKKRSVSMVADQIYLPISERFVDLDPKPMEFIREYIESEGYLCVVKGGNTTLREYKPSEFVLRSIMSDRLTEKNNRSTLSKLSELYALSGKEKRFKYERIQRSGIYVKLIEHEKQYGELTTRDVDVFEKYFRTPYRNSQSSMAKFYNTFKDFQKYKEYYFSKKKA